MIGFSFSTLLAFKSVWQYYVPARDVLGLLDGFRRMVNESLRIGIANDASSLRRLALLSYNQLAHYDSPSHSRRGREKFARSRPPILLEAQGRAFEAVKGNPTPTVIPGVDAPKLTPPTKSWQNQVLT